MDRHDLKQVLWLILLAFVFIIIHLAVHPILVQLGSSAITSTQNSTMYTASEKGFIVGLIYLIENLFLIGTLVDLLVIISKIIKK